QTWRSADGHSVVEPVKLSERFWTRSVFGPDSQLIAAVATNSVQVWHAGTGTPLTPPLPHGSAIHDVSFSPDGRYLLTTGENSRLWDLAAARIGPQPLESVADDEPVDTDVSWDGRYVLTLGETGKFRVWDAQRRQPLGPLREAPGTWTAGWISPDGRRVVTAGPDPAAKPPKATAEAGANLWTLDGGPVWNAARRLQLWDTATGEAVGPLQTHTTIGAAWFSPDNRSLYVEGPYYRQQIANASRIYSSEIAQYEAATGHLVKSLRRQDVVWKIGAISRDSRRLSVIVQTPNPPNQDQARKDVGPESSDLSCAVQVWDAASLEPVGPLLPHDADVLSVAFSPDARRVIT